MKKTMSVILAFLILVGALAGYYYDPFYITYVINKDLNISGIKLLMPKEEVEEKLGKREQYLPGMGGYGYGYDSLGIFISFSSDRDGFTFDKVAWIRTKNPANNVYGVQVGNRLADAVKILRTYGYKPENPAEPGRLQKGNLYINLLGDEHITGIMVGIMDRKLKGRIY